METKGKCVFKFDELYLQRAREQFIDWLKNTLGKEVKASEIDIYCGEDGRFDLVYRKWDVRDQISIKRICYPDTSINTMIELNSKTYCTSITNVVK